MQEPKFTDAWCYGKAFEAKSKICQVCLANKPCQNKFYRALGVSRPKAAAALPPDGDWKKVAVSRTAPGAVLNLP